MFPRLKIEKARPYISTLIVSFIAFLIIGCEKPDDSINDIILSQNKVFLDPNKSIVWNLTPEKNAVLVQNSIDNKHAYAISFDSYLDISFPIIGGRIFICDQKGNNTVQGWDGSTCKKPMLVSYFDDGGEFVTPIVINFVIEIDGSVSFVFTEIQEDGMINLLDRLEGTNGIPYWISGVEGSVSTDDLRPLVELGHTKVTIKTGMSLAEDQSNHLFIIKSIPK